MSNRYDWLTLSCAAALAVSSGVNAKEVIDLGDLEVSHELNDEAQSTSDDIYRSYDSVDTGASIISEKTIKNASSPGINTTELIESLPFVQQDNQQDIASKENIQSLRPRDFAISGGNFYDNNIQIDGVSVNSVHDVTGPKSQLDWDNVLGQTAQTVYVNPALLGDVEVLDSNVSARYGDFTGGVVHFYIRDPKKYSQVNLGASFQSDRMVSYHDPEDLGEEPETPPEFTKYTSTVVVDQPVTDRFFLLGAYSRAQSSVVYQEDPEYGGTEHKRGDQSDNFFIKGLYEYSDDLTLRGQLLYSPYESERDLPRARDDLMISDSTGLVGLLSANGVSNNTVWESKLSTSFNDSSRKSNSTRYLLDGEFLDWCRTDKNCHIGGVGNIDQTQSDYSWKTHFTTDFNSGTLSYGADLNYTKAEKSRDEDAFYYTTPRKTRGDDYQCAENDSSCYPKMANRRYLRYGQYDATVGVYSHALWGEYLTEFGPVEIRGGARYSYDNFLKNHNLAPRLTVAWEFMDDTYLTFGANRYYGNKMIGYALREKIPATECYERTVKDGEAPGEWEACRRPPKSNRYGGSVLDTPYGDEFTAALTIPTVLDGNVRLKTVVRKNRDQFSRGEEITGADGNPYYEMENNGKTDYIGYAIEWSGNYKRRHFFNASVSISETKNYGLLDYSSDSEKEDELVYYNGQVITYKEMYEDDARQNFAAPLKASIGWSASWFSNTLTTHADLNFRGRYKYFQDTKKDYSGDDCDRCDIYAKEKDASVTTVNLKTNYRFWQQQQSVASVELKIKNLLNKAVRLPSSYTTGRSVWASFQYTF